MDDFFDEKVEEIKEKYKELGLYTSERKKEECDGWRFLYCPKSKITDNNGLLILGLNPGAGYEKDKKCLPYCEENEYSYQWDKGCNDNIQRNIESLFKKISKKYGKSSKDIVDGSLTSNLIPFRSKDIEELANLKLKKECFGFSRELWTDIIEKNDFKVIICLGNSESGSSYSNVKDILEKRHGDFDTNKISIKWGENTIKYCEVPCENNRILLVGLPHFSHFSFIERPESKKAVDEISEKIAEYIK